MKKTDTTKRAQEKRKGFTKKIGNTTYDVSFHYSQQSRENCFEVAINKNSEGVINMNNHALFSLYQKRRATIF